MKGFEPSTSAVRLQFHRIEDAHLNLKNGFILGHCVPSRLGTNVGTFMGTGNCATTLVGKLERRSYTEVYALRTALCLG